MVNSFDDVAPAKAMQGAKQALDTYGQARSRIQDVRDKTEGVYKRARGNVPELF